MKYEVFMKNYGEKKLGLKSKEDQNRKKMDNADLYHFNIDIMYILRARMHVLEDQLQKKLKRSQKFRYICPNCGARKSEEEQAISKKCRTCGVELKRDVNDNMSPDVLEGCNQIIKSLKEDLDKLKKYRIPPKFFGPAAGKY